MFHITDELSCKSQKSIGEVSEAMEMIVKEAAKISTILQLLFSLTVFHPTLEISLIIYTRIPVIDAKSIEQSFIIFAFVHLTSLHGHFAMAFELALRDGADIARPSEPVIFSFPVVCHVADPCEVISLGSDIAGLARECPVGPVTLP